MKFIRANNQTEVPKVKKLLEESGRGKSQVLIYDNLKMAEMIADYAHNSLTLMHKEYGIAAISSMSSVLGRLGMRKTDIVEIVGNKTNMVLQPKAKLEVKVTEESAIALLKSLGYKLMKPITEYEEV